MNNFLESVTDRETIDRYFKSAVKEIKTVFKKLKEINKNDSNRVWFHIGLLTRLIASVVMYGDRKDTAEFMQQETIEEKIFGWKEEKKVFEEKLSVFKADTPYK